jgi:hypothetical protein
MRSYTAMRKSTTLFGTIALLSLGSASAWAGNLTVPNDFVAGTKAVAADVNANFNEVETQVNDNDSRITTNAADIATNTTAIGTKAAAADVTTNTGNITANTAAIGANSTNISTNTTDIATNAADIATNTTAIGTKAAAADVTTNTTNITANTTNITANTADVATNTSNISTNAADIATNTSDISTNATDIATNTSNITTNATNITALQQSGNKAGTPCAGNDSNDIMVRVGPLCVDAYEASVWTTADGSTSGTQFGDGVDDYDTGTVNSVVCSNNGSDCTGANTIYARSEAGVNPSTDITWYQAQQACAASGKRLLTNAEWQMAAAGTPDSGATDNGTDQCRVSTGNGATGSRSACVSNYGVYDMNGNVWEWVGDWVHGDNTDTWAPASSTTAGGDYGDDVVSDINAAANQGTNSTSQPAAIFRGGRGTAGSNSGIFAIVANTAPSLENVDVGFRCAR